MQVQPNGFKNLRKTCCEKLILYGVSEVNRAVLQFPANVFGIHVAFYLVVVLSLPPTTAIGSSIAVKIT